MTTSKLSEATPEGIKHCVAAVSKKGHDVPSSFAICIDAAQKRGDIEPGTLHLTGQGEGWNAKHTGERGSKSELSAKEKRMSYEKLLKKARNMAKSGFAEGYPSHPGLGAVDLPSGTHRLQQDFLDLRRALTPRSLGADFHAVDRALAVLEQTIGEIMDLPPEDRFSAIRKIRQALVDLKSQLDLAASQSESRQSYPQMIYRVAEQAKELLMPNRMNEGALDRVRTFFGNLFGGGRGDVSVPVAMDGASMQEQESLEAMQRLLPSLTEDERRALRNELSMRFRGAMQQAFDKIFQLRSNQMGTQAPTASVNGTVRVSPISILGAEVLQHEMKKIAGLMDGQALLELNARKPVGSVVARIIDGKHVELVKIGEKEHPTRKGHKIGMWARVKQRSSTWHPSMNRAPNPKHVQQNNDEAESLSQTAEEPSMAPPPARPKLSNKKTTGHATAGTDRPARGSRF